MNAIHYHEWLLDQLLIFILSLYFLIFYENNRRKAFFLLASKAYFLCASYIFPFVLFPGCLNTYFVSSAPFFYKSHLSGHLSIADHLSIAELYTFSFTLAHFLVSGSKVLSGVFSKRGTFYKKSKTVQENQPCVALS